MVDTYTIEGGRTIYFIDIKDKVAPIEVKKPLDKDTSILSHTIQFTRAEWWSNDLPFVLLRYEINNQEHQYGLRMDMDKKSVIDSFEDEGFPPAADEQLQRLLSSIYAAVYFERRVFSLELALAASKEDLSTYHAVTANPKNALKDDPPPIRHAPSIHRLLGDESQPE